MKNFRLIVAVLLFAFTVFIATPSQADPIAEISPDYLQITQQINELLKYKSNPEESGYNAEELQSKIGQLQYQKVLMENTEDWGICQNLTGRTLGIFAHKGGKVTPVQQNTLFYLSDGQVTDGEDWDCDGIYIPSDLKVKGVTPSIDGTAQVAKIYDGTNLIITTNPLTGEVEFNTPLADVVSANEFNSLTLSQADIDVRKPNAPTD